MNKSGATISGYTTSANCVDMNYPFRQCIDSLLMFCDEVVIVDSGSTDGTIEEIQKISKRDSRVKFFVEPVDFNDIRWAIHNDGNLKGKARAKCTADYCWQMDMDEVVHQEDVHKVKKLPALLGDNLLMMLPMVEFWGSFEYIRSDFFTWKLRFGKNDKRIVHGIPRQHKLIDAQGKPYIRPFYSDGCNFLMEETQEDVPYIIPLPVPFESLNKMSQEEYENIFFQCLDELPFVLHVSWLDLKRKIRHYKKFWHKYQISMYNLSLADTAENNVMYNKPWSEVTEADIAEKEIELKRIGPRSFHHKIDYSKIGRIIPYRRSIPDSLRAWWILSQMTTQVARPVFQEMSVSP